MSWHDSVIMTGSKEKSAQHEKDGNKSISNFFSKLRKQKFPLCHVTLLEHFFALGGHMLPHTHQHLVFNQ